MSFQLTASRGGWHPKGDEKLQGMIFQLTASRGGWRTHTADMMAARIISTHSLTRRLTMCNWRFKALCRISTHSLTRRLTSTYTRRTCWMAFQLTASRGGWRRSQWLSVTEHTFQLTASRGGWRVFLYRKSEKIIFQLTASRGGWRYGVDSSFEHNYISTHSLTRRLT